LIHARGTPRAFDWDRVPNFVIGRVGWDSFLTQWALDDGLDVIDATTMLHAAHFTGSDGNAAGWNTKRSVLVVCLFTLLSTPCAHFLI
jgi:hypothetical protein